MTAGALQIHRDEDLVIVAFPARWLRLEVDDLDGNPRTAERPETLRQVLARRPDVVAAVDAAMFEVADGKSYATSQQSRLVYRYLDRRSNINVPSAYPNRGATLSVDSNGRAFVLEGDAVCDNAVFAHQGYPNMIQGGRVVTSRVKDADRNGRAALLRCEDGRVAFATSRSGIYDLAERLTRLPSGLRATDAFYLDGGGSTAQAALQNGAMLVSVGLDARRVPAYVLAVQTP